MKKILLATTIITSLNVFAAEEFKVFSNPSSSVINLGDLKTEVSLIGIYDGNECLVLTAVIDKNNPVIEIGQLPYGVYRLVGTDVFEDVVQEGTYIQL